MTGLGRGYYPVPLRPRAMARVLKIQTCALGRFSGTVAVVIGAFILAVFLALFNYLTPSGKVTVAGRVVEVIPNVTGQIIAIPVKTNVPVKSGAALFQIDPAPFQYKVGQLKPTLAGAKPQAAQCTASDHRPPA